MIEAVVGSASGDEEIEYWRIRIGGSIAKNSPRGRAADGYSSKMSSGERRLRVISLSKMSPASSRICERTAASGQLAAIFVTF